MSIYIKGIKAPGDCRECQFINYSAISGRTWCGVTGETFAVDFRVIPFEGISEKCPIEEIPPHGRLIDADEMVKLWRGCKFNGDIECLINARPTVIEGD